ncbi:MAG: hypothetical protein F2736_05280 [Actinobacteria bacterium]|nr:hypothetical protein [Actinomycetota bacterium]MSX82186.1 hypothetical protein [Actinomycetota bacterium]MSY07122.1 hypothetical protein [Actinomycetota bacterium]
MLHRLWRRAKKSEEERRRAKKSEEERRRAKKKRIAGGVKFLGGNNGKGSAQVDARPDSQTEADLGRPKYRESA